MQHVGIDFAGGVELAQHTEALADPGAGAGAGAARTDPPADAEAGLPSFTDTAFSLYYDEVAEKYDMRDPLVVAPDGSEVECSKPSSLERGVRYFCVVTLKDDKYTAEVLTESGAEGKAPGDYDAVWKVHLFNVPKEGEEDYGDEEPGHEDGMQYHTGAIVVGGGGSVDVDVDDISIGLDGGKLEIHDFHDSKKSVDDKTLAERLTEDRMPAATEYQLLARAPGNPNSLGYIPLGNLEPPYKAGDGIQIDPKGSDGKQEISCTVTVPDVDGRSLDTNSDGARQIKGWKDAAASGSSLASDLMGDAAPADLVLVKSGGNLVYKAIGRITGMGYTGTVYCDKLTWSGSSLSKVRQTLTYANGLLTGVTEGASETLFSTVAHSTLHPEF